MLLVNVDGQVFSGEFRVVFYFLLSLNVPLPDRALVTLVAKSSFLLVIVPERQRSGSLAHNTSSMCKDFLSTNSVSPTLYFGACLHSSQPLQGPFSRVLVWAFLCIRVTVI